MLRASYPAATAENVTYAHGSVVSSNKGKSRLTTIQDQSGATGAGDIAYGGPHWDDQGPRASFEGNVHSGGLGR